MFQKILTGFLSLFAIYYLLISLTRNGGAYFLFVILANAALTSYFLTREYKPEKLWFKAKLYGYGWKPATKEGWALTGLFIMLTIPAFILSSEGSNSATGTLITALPFFLLSLSTFIAICYRVGEKPAWHWGRKKGEGVRVQGEEKSRFPSS